MLVKSRRRAFTLVELLVVISIIALLMGILMPALSKARGQAQTIVCASHLKNYGMALHMYADDNDDYAPFVYYWLYSKETLDNSGRGGCPKGCRWHYDGDEPDGSLWPYLPDKNVHMCPTFKSYASKAECPNPSHSDTIAFNPSYSYSMNFFIGFDWATYLSIGNEIMNREVSMKLSKVKKSSTCFAFSEENLWLIQKALGDNENYTGAVLNDNNLWVAPNEGGYTDNIATFHNVSSSKKNEGKADVVYVDGHVKTIRGKPENEAYLEYGIPYSGHKNLDPLW